MISVHYSVGCWCNHMCNVYHMNVLCVMENGVALCMYGVLVCCVYCNYYVFEMCVVCCVWLVHMSVSVAWCVSMLVMMVWCCCGVNCKHMHGWCGQCVPFIMLMARGVWCKYVGVV